MTTADIIEAIRADIKRDLRDEILAELSPEIERRLYANIFTLAEAAKFLKLADRTLRKMVAEKEIPYFRQRSNIYFRQMDLDRWIQNRMIHN